MRSLRNEGVLEAVVVSKRPKRDKDGINEVRLAVELGEAAFSMYPTDEQFAQFPPEGEMVAVTYRLRVRQKAVQGGKGAYVQTTCAPLILRIQAIGAVGGLESAQPSAATENGRGRGVFSGKAAA